MVIFCGDMFWSCFRKILLAVALSAWLSSPSMAQSAIEYTNSVDSSIPDGSISCTNFLDRQFVVPENYTVDDVDIGILIRHPLRAHLRITLISPSGTTRTVHNATGGARSNLNVLFDSALATSITTHSVLNDTAAVATIVPPYQRNFAPVQSFNNFAGQNANGTWILRICDNVPNTTGTFLHATLIIKPRPATLSITKTSEVQTDLVSGLNPKSVPGARMRYCITISNIGPGLATTISGTDIIPPNTSYVPNSLRSGTNCASTSTAEDDDAVGADESDPMGASVAGSVLSLSAPTMANAASFALAFLVTVN